MKAARVLLAEDHAIVADGIAKLLGSDVEVVGSVADGRALVESAQNLKPDVIVADISMPVMNGLEAVRQIRKRGVRAKTIFLTMHTDAQLASAAIRAGASGYLLKHCAGEELKTALNEVLKGRTYVTPHIAKELLSVLTTDDRGLSAETQQLTERQREVLQLLAEGRSMKEVAGTLNISARTVEAHKYEMMRVLGIKTTAELVRFAVKSHIVEP